VAAGQPAGLRNARLLVAQQEARAVDRSNRNPVAARPEDVPPSAALRAANAHGCAAHSLYM
jgi:hypothetical protein